MVTPSAMEMLFLLLLFSGFWPFCHGISKGFVLIQQQNTWHEAQAYCRQNHTDLATVLSDDPNLQEAINPALTSLAWTGLYRVGNNWWWIYLMKKTTFTFWKPGEPNNLNGNDECGVITNSGWIDLPCNEMCPFFCYNVNGTAQFVFISDIQLSWHDAINYCRLKYTDLVSIWNQTENDQLLLMMQGFDRAWVGLYWATWSWSDKSSGWFNWMTGQPNQTGLNNSCGAVGPDALMDDRICSDALPFICLTCTKQKIVRVEVNSGQNLNDPAVMETILKSIKQKLKDHGIEQDTRLTWRVLPGGNVFSPKHGCEENIKQRDCSDSLF
ncbi:macrophage mannose receptor 1-like [Triplophysa rosa]|uniref:L-selectin-like n=1 Tax=Triplophysa rosa TaxID=992332 RepID=A0A9W7W862_TRIRA|nr:macrophage mannose receptor 1-like [Triplophysa rosa]KAI7789630.1 putative L-selectin-like [Triplophysa rosa]